MVRPELAIGAPRFELGTSPTRTVRATRLRHAPEAGIIAGASRAARNMRRTRPVAGSRPTWPRPRRRRAAGRSRRSRRPRRAAAGCAPAACRRRCARTPAGARDRGPGVRARPGGRRARPSPPYRERGARRPYAQGVGWQDHPYGGYGCLVASRDEFVAFLDDHLDAGGYPDALPVGLQVTGAAEVTKVATGVSASLELFERAASEGAQMLIVHHGLFWSSEPRRIGERERARLRCLFDHDLSLVAYHLALDAHPEVGNNALICRALGLVDPVGFGVHGDRTIGFLATADPPLPLAGLLDRVRAEINPEPLVFDAGPASIRRVAVSSGAAAQDVLPAADAGADCFLTGEPREPVMAQAREAGIHFVAAGHYATEVFGVRALGELLAQRFGVEHSFIDVPNPI